VLYPLATRTRALYRDYRWQWLDPSHNEGDIPIPSLIGPLRYDVATLRDLLLFYLAHRDLAKDNFSRFVAEARRQSYYEWRFANHAIRCPKERPDPAIWGRVFVRTVHQAIDVWESIQQQGFDRRFPIEVRITDRLLPVANGKRITTRYILGDGSHRLACLMVLGYSALPRDFYRIRWYRRLRPDDATWLLTRKGLILPEEYFAFLSMVYGSPQVFRDRDDFLRDVRHRTPDRMDEIRTVLDVDGFAGR
jgi:hypothetical protein